MAPKNFRTSYPRRSPEESNLDGSNAVNKKRGSGGTPSVETTDSFATPSTRPVRESSSRMSHRSGGARTSTDTFNVRRVFGRVKDAFQKLKRHGEVDPAQVMQRARAVKDSVVEQLEWTKIETNIRYARTKAEEQGSKFWKWLTYDNITKATTDAWARFVAFVISMSIVLSNFLHLENARDVCEGKMIAAWLSIRHARQSFIAKLEAARNSPERRRLSGVVESLTMIEHVRDEVENRMITAIILAGRSKSILIEHLENARNADQGQNAIASFTFLEENARQICESGMVSVMMLLDGVRDVWKRGIEDGIVPTTKKLTLQLADAANEASEKYEIVDKMHRFNDRFGLSIYAVHVDRKFCIADTIDRVALTTVGKVKVVCQNETVSGLIDRAKRLDQRVATGKMQDIAVFGYETISSIWDHYGKYKSGIPVPPVA